MSFVTGRKVYLKNLSSSYLPYFAQIVITIVITPMLINTFGQERYGVYVLLNTFIAYFTLSNIGLPQTLIREIIHAKEENNNTKINQMISSTFFYYLIAITGVFLVNILLFYVDIFNLNTKILSTENISLIQSFSLGMLLVSILFGIRLVTEIFDAIIKATNKIYITQIVKLINVILLGVSTFVALKIYGSIEAVLIANAIASFFVLFILVAQSKKLIDFTIDLKLSSFQVFKEMLPSSFWYFIGGISVLLIYQTDNIIISTFISLSMVGIFAISYKISDTIKQLILQISNITFSYFAKSNLSNYETKKQLLLMMFVILILSIFSYTLIYLVLKDIIEIWIQDLQFYQPELFFLIAITHIMQLIVSPLSIYAGAKNIHKNVVIVGLIQGLLNIMLSIILVNYYDIYGVVIATLLSFVMTNFIFNIHYILFKKLGEIK